MLDVQSCAFPSFSLFTSLSPAQMRVTGHGVARGRELCVGAWEGLLFASLQNLYRMKKVSPKQA